MPFTPVSVREVKNDAEEIMELLARIALEKLSVNELSGTPFELTDSERDAVRARMLTRVAVLRAAIIARVSTW